ncbi:protein involved in response to salt stress [Artemisia annua]|uniref:Protein involved in response to salt stress n=1 Tax=Artemisia annua TaxID=35608 RepID=A0A2U1Q7I4_ARTAN|nr:protein involved in response to salt stress [Artemisia annua]
MSFMSSLKSAAASAVTGGDDDKKNTGSDQSSNSDLMASAKLVAEAAQNATSNQSDKIDKPKVAGAAADLLDAAKTYGKFDETQGVGQYLKKADDYLHEYEKSGAAAPPAAKEEGHKTPFIQNLKWFFHRLFWMRPRWNNWSLNYYRDRHKVQACVNAVKIEARRTAEDCYEGNTDWVSVVQA